MCSGYNTARNILDTGEFVINLVPERLVQMMNITAVNAPAGTDELALADLRRGGRIISKGVAFDLHAIL